MEKLKATFLRFANNEAKGKSPLYEYWCRRIITHEPLLNVIMHIPQTQPKPNLFFSAVQYLAVQSETALKQVFDNPKDANLEQSFQLLIAFCTEYQIELIQLFQTKLVQTNEVQRASYLYPLLSEIAAEVEKPLTIIEIGTSAGLLLNVDHYHYNIQQSETITFGDEISPLTLYAKNLGDPIVITQKPIIHNRIGIDLNIIDVNDEEQYLWLQSLIWPELIDRKLNLERARPIHEQCEKQLLTGDFTALLPKLLANEAYKATQIVIFHIHVANQFPSQLKHDLLELLQYLSKQHSIYHIYNNIYDADLHVDFINQGQTISKKTLHQTDGHGNYFYWKQGL
ncbi:DUF2332 domain-containing protein [Solibacillus sp. MA9]|uniref:DUF2332 domain-containing protein n=1 Tax=Solibacillus palustris TaxID=2908203 RepID=A0ABS9UBB1_9BACL|nr:DUF2332 domain-containing protein [Solibacillus sp. MA9]MCH7321508.1 DUF2332 domain-containing protein [Solibacillus sp. MA9]